MFIADKKSCSIDNGPGVRYVLVLAEGGNEVSVNEIISDIKKYPWIDGITIQTEDIHIHTKDCIQFIEQLPKRLTVLLKIPLQDVESLDEKLLKAISSMSNIKILNENDF